LGGSPTYLLFIVVTLIEQGVSQCEQAPDCASCTQIENCVWCLSTNGCKLNSSCPLTGYNDCCILYDTCSDCISNPTCAFCKYGTRQNIWMCRGNSTDPSCNQESQFCTAEAEDSMDFIRFFMLGLSLVIGSSFLLLGLVLLIVFIYGRNKRLEAQAELKKIYQDRHLVSQTIAEIENLKVGSYTTLAPLISKMRVEKT